MTSSNSERARARSDGRDAPFYERGRQGCARAVRGCSGTTIGLSAPRFSSPALRAGRMGLRSKGDASGRPGSQIRARRRVMSFGEPTGDKYRSRTSPIHRDQRLPFARSVNRPRDVLGWSPRRVWGNPPRIDGRFNSF